MQCNVKERVVRKLETVEVECFKCREKGHKCRVCPLWKEGKKLRAVREAAHVAMPQKTQQKEWRRSSAYVLRQKAQEHCGEGIPDEACLLELGWYTKEVVVSYVECERCGRKGCQVEENRGQGVISERQKWCGYQKRKKTEVARSEKGKTQQSGTQARALESAAKEEDRQREVRRTFKMLREV